MSFVRNRYFYGKLLDVRHLEMEQRYLNEKRWLLNRLGLGSGVLCGLDVTASGGRVRIAPGVAIDGLGREIVIPEPFVVKKPFAITDDCGLPTGDEAKDEATICLAFHECDTELAPVLVSECDVREACAPGATRERYMVLVHDGAATPAPWPCERATDPKHVLPTDFGTKGRSAYGTIPGASVLLPHERAAAPAGGLARGTADTSTTASTNDLRTLFCTMLEGSCAPPDELCVPLATLTRNGADISVEECLSRTLVPSNAELLGLIGGLFGALSERLAPDVLEYVDGDGQTGKPSQPLDKPLSVEVVDGDGNPVKDANVRFRARAGGGKVGADAASVQDAFEAQTDDAGEASAIWELGAKGLNTIEAAADGGSRIVFHAFAEGGR